MWRLHGGRRGRGLVWSELGGGRPRHFYVCSHRDLVIGRTLDEVGLLGWPWWFSFCAVLSRIGAEGFVRLFFDRWLFVCFGWSFCPGSALLRCDLFGFLTTVRYLFTRKDTYNCGIT